MKLIDKILSIIIVFLSLIIIAVTVVTLSRNKKNLSDEQELVAQGKAVSLMAPKNDDKISYFNLGSIRILTLPDNRGLSLVDNQGLSLVDMSLVDNQGLSPVEDEDTAANIEKNIENLGTVLLITPWISYSSSDTIFFEEISRKKPMLCGIFQNYFSQFSKKELLSQSENTIEENITNQINSHLSLGKIQGIYFTDYIFLE